MTWCPKCGVHPPRRPWTGRGRVAECVACWRLNRAAHSRAVSRRRSEQLALRRGPVHLRHMAPQTHAERWRQWLDSGDISPAEIEQRYQAALAEIRQRQRSEAV
jgi:hypothetical protein